MEINDIPEDISELFFFKNVVTDIRLLMDLYHDYFMKQKSQNGQLSVPLSYTVVRAIETCFYSKDLNTVVGCCTFCSIDKDGNVKVAGVRHQWLSWREKYIIDVVPLDGMFGLSIPQAVIPKKEKGMIRFNAFSNTYPENCNLETKRKLDSEVESLSNIFDELMSKVPS